MAENINEKVLWEGFGLRPQGRTKTRAGVVFKTSCGPKELRRYLKNAAQADFEGRLRDRLVENGFSETRRLNKARAGDYFFEYGGSCYILEDYGEGRELDFFDETDIIRAAGLLARFHNAAEGMVCSGSQPPPLTELYLKRLRELKKVKKQADGKGSLSPMDITVKKYYAAAADACKLASDLLSGGAYSRISGIAEKNKSVCHNSFKGENITIQEGGAMLLSGYHLSGRGCTALDMAELMRRYIRIPLSTVSGGEKLLAEYTRERELTEDERTVIYALLIYPQKFFRLINENYNRRRSCVSGAMSERLEAAASEILRGADIRRLLLD